MNVNDKYLDKFRKWDYNYNKNSQLALVFENWWTLIKRNTWDELDRFPKVNKRPDDLVLLNLIVNDPESKYFDKLSTDKKETAGDIIRTSFDDLAQSWLILPLKWGDYNQIKIMHMSNIPIFSKLNQSSSGHPNSINALFNNWGPALRFIVEMNEKPKGYGVYAGAQSGNPASAKYSGFLDDWTNGKYYELNFFYNKEEAKLKAKYKWTIN